MSRTYSIRVCKPAEYATLTMTLDDDVTDMDDVWMEAKDLADHKDGLGEIDWELSDWFVEVVDVEEIV